MAFFVAGMLAGSLALGFALVGFARGRMIEVQRSPLPFEETVKALEASVRKAGWMLPESRRFNESLERGQVFLPKQVHLIKLCHPQHAAGVLAEDPRMACLMPCTFAVYEGDDGEVFVSKMNTGLMGRVFGGSVARIMGGAVAREEKEMLARALRG